MTSPMKATEPPGVKDAFKLVSTNVSSPFRSYAWDPFDKSNSCCFFQLRNGVLCEEKEDHRISSAPNKFNLTIAPVSQSFVQANHIKKRPCNTLAFDTLLLLVGL